ncbi:L,D-transpeptidase family protein [Salipiger sp.]|uniref:L,D-transpeptidase family protein n=1 Tax=Salipiger sp. TaxID=2078585 RepID=UPI003A97FFE5
MRSLRILLMVGIFAALSGCASQKFRSYHGPEITHVVVNKGDRRLYLLHNDKVLKTYKIGLGFRPEGDKKVMGDGRTPEGNYFIDRRNPNSKFHLSIGISYPNPVDVIEAAELGKSPGGDIFIHGRPRAYRKGGRDWTAGCIAVTDRQMEDIYAMVRTGTPITINP